MVEVPRHEDNSKTGKQLESGGKQSLTQLNFLDSRRKTFENLRKTVR